ncbi:ATP-binding cassette domain-containing protein [Agromyces sp. NPDC058136]|uniref:ATP-binding cassette domain-containing protein n=1 Tax=Agromyces sp. NPDC058136 TaxID=3346354 RepID=UPI0036DADF28
MNQQSIPAISVRGLRKSYKQKVVLDGIDLDVAPGSIFALLGPNGAGKTTMVHILTTLLRPDGGEARVGGFDVTADADGVRSLIGLTGQFAAVDTLLTGRENLQLMADLRHLPKRQGRARVDALLEQFDLVEAAGKPLSTYSGGMRRRLDLAMTLVDEPRIIFLDEPTTGLDPRSRRTMWQIVRGLADRGVTIFLTTQYLEEADELADRIALLDGGRFVAEGTATELKRRIGGGRIRLQFADATALATAADALVGAADGIERDDETLTLEVPSDGGFGSVKQVLGRLDDGAPVEGLEIRTPDLDDVFFALTGHGTQTKENAR